MSEREVITNPAFALAGFSRVTGQGNFFASSVDSGHYITFRVYKAKLEHGNGRDWIFPDGALPIIEIAMTNYQFAEMITAMNMGHGVPVTLQHFNGKNIPRLPKQDSEADRVQQDFVKSVHKNEADVREQAKEVREILKKDKLSKSDKSQIESLLSQLTQRSTEKTPFYLEQFNEAVEKQIVEAKSEVDAFMTHTIYKTGLDTLRAQAENFRLGESKEALQIEDKKK